MTEKASLYERLGGLEAIQFLARTLVTRAMLNPTIGHIWDHKTEDEVQAEINGFVDFLSEHWGGDLKFTGRDMASVHRGMGVTEEYWNALFDDVITPAYEEFQIDPEIAQEVDAFLRSFKPVIVGSPSFKDVVKANPEMDVMQGMKSVGITWPAPAHVAGEHVA